MKIRFEMEEEKKKFEYLSKSQLREKIDEFEQRQKKLYGIHLSPEQQEELYCLDDIMNELKKRIEDLKPKTSKNN